MKKYIKLYLKFTFWCAFATLSFTPLITALILTFTYKNGLWLLILLSYIFICPVYLVLYLKGSENDETH